jgi:hypothetical protein
MAITNMRLVVMDVAGHLTQFSMVPPQREDVREAGAPQAPMNWTLFFDAAGLDMGTFKPVESTWVPNSYADERKAWEGPMPGRPDITLHADAASYRGQPAFFQIAGPWSRTLRQTQEVPRRSVIRFLQFLIVFGLSIGTCVLARRNYVTGRGDRRGATRVAIAWLIFYFVSWLLGARLWLEPLTEFTHFLREYAAVELLNAAIIWLVYMALEPYVRRYSADILMSWSRLLGGRLRDPRVGRDVLVGIVAGLTISIVGGLVGLAPAWLGYPPVPPRNLNTLLEFLLSTRRGLSVLLSMPMNALLYGMLTTLLFALVRMAVKRTWIATLVTIIVGTFVLVSTSGTQYVWLNAAAAVVLAVVFVGVLVRFGMFPLMMTFLINNIATSGLTTDVGKLYAPTAIWLMALVAAMAAFGYYASRAGEPLFGKLSET